MGCGMAGDLQVLLFTGIEEEGRLGQSRDTAENCLAQVSVRSDTQWGCSTSKGSSSRTLCLI